MKILIWGAGALAVKFSNFVKNYSSIFDDEIVAIVDSDPDKWGRNMLGIIISSPKTIEEEDFDKIIISSSNYFDNILRELKDEYYVMDIAICSIIDYISEKIVEHQYRRNKDKNNLRIPNDYQKFDSNSLVVYTAIMGDYDSLKEPLVVEDGVDYVCYTNQKTVKSDVWNVQYVEMDACGLPELLVRKYKLLPHRFLHKYNTSVWIDASMQITGKLKDLINIYQDKSNLLLFPHPERLCIYDEFAACLTIGKISRTVGLAQIKKYLDECYPEGNGLYCGGLLVRNHMIKSVAKLMEDWFSEVETYTSRDQISLPYVIWKNNFTIDLCDLNIYKNEYIHIYPHKNV